MDASSLPLWPLIITIEDVFVPDAAPYVVEGVAGLDDHTCAVTIALVADAAGYNLQWQVN
jgi:hypothetical protein